MNKKEKLENCLKLLEDVSSFTIPKIDELSDEVGRELPEFVKGDFSTFSEEEKELADRLVVRLFNSRVAVYEDHINRWDKELFIPNEEELKSLKSYQKDKFDRIILPTYAFLKTQFPSLHDKYEKEEKVSREYKKTLDKLLKNDEYRQKAEELLRKYNNSPASSQNKPSLDNNDVKKMADLLNKVNELEEKLKQTPNSESGKQELARLKAEIEDLKNKQKDKSQNEKGQDKKSNFPTGLVVGCGILIVVLLLVIIFLARKITKS